MATTTAPFRTIVGHDRARVVGDVLLSPGGPILLLRIVPLYFLNMWTKAWTQMEAVDDRGLAKFDEIISFPRIVDEDVARALRASA